jgi:hypothetical protein
MPATESTPASSETPCSNRLNANNGRNERCEQQSRQGQKFFPAIHEKIAQMAV